ncbi:MAG: hypothetical protein ACRC7W_02480 [Fusobacteriaceae bacterium]
MKAFNKDRKPKHTTKGVWGYSDFYGDYALLHLFARRKQIFHKTLTTLCYGKLKLNKNGALRG